eukprot:5771877-Pyramimonas_sp.AAC.1
MELGGKAAAKPRGQAKAKAQVINLTLKKKPAAQPAAKGPAAADPEITPTVRRNFFADLKGGHVHEAIKTDVQRIQDHGYGKNKGAQLN